MQSREKLLGLSLAGVVGLYFGMSLLDKWVFDPIQTLDTSIGAKGATLSGHEKTKLDILLANQRLADARRTSLPPEPSTARILYQRWLTDLAVGVCGFRTFDPEPQGAKGTGDPFWTIPFRFTADATYDEALRFLKRFSEVDLLQQITHFDAVPSKLGEERLRLTVNIEALALASAPPRTTLFAQTQLRESVGRDQAQLTVAGTTGFPQKAPFAIRIGNEWMNVTQIQGTQWMVQRGVDSAAVEHAAGAIAEHVPLRSSPPGAGVQDAYRVLIAVNPFRKPGPKIEYKPRLAPSGTQQVVRDKPLALKMETQSRDPAWGDPRYEIEGDAPAGLTLDPATGELKWSPSDDVAPGEYKVRIAATFAAAPDNKVTSDLTLKLRNPNRAPEFKSVEAPKAYLGRPLSLDLSADDPDGDRLRYSLTGTPPAGAAIDERTGKLTWTPSEDLSPGEYRVEVSVVDTGDPPITETQTVTIKTDDDAARFTELTTVVEINGVKQARFYNRLTKKITVLHEGDEFSFSDVTGKVLEIGKDYIIMETGDARMRLGLELEKPSIRNLTPAPEPAQTAPVSAPEKTPQDEPQPAENSTPESSSR